MLLNTFLYQNAVGSSGVSYFFEERFEGTGYQNSWTESGTGTKDEDYTTSPLEGSQSLLLSGTAQTPQTTVVLSSDQSELWCFFRLRVDTAPNVTRQIVQYRNSSAALVGAVNLVVTTNALQARNGAQAGVATVDGLTVGTDYNVWFYWKKGTGADGIARVGFSTSGTEVTSGNAFTQTLVGNSVTDAHDIHCGFTSNTTGAIVLDKILISTTATIGNDPA